MKNATRGKEKPEEGMYKNTIDSNGVFRSLNGEVSPTVLDLPYPCSFMPSFMDLSFKNRLKTVMFQCLQLRIWI